MTVYKVYQSLTRDGWCDDDDNQDDDNDNEIIVIPRYKKWPAVSVNLQ